MSSSDDYDADPTDPRDANQLARVRQSRIQHAKDRVRAPAVVMLAFAILSLVGVPLGAINFLTLPEMFKQQRDQIDQDPNIPAAQKQEIKGILDVYEKTIMLMLPFTLTLQLIVGVLSVVGSLKMLQMRSHGWGMTAAVLNIISIGHGCCFLSLPVGIWAMIVLMNDRVKAGYVAAREQAGARNDDPDSAHDQYQY